MGEEARQQQSILLLLYVEVVTAILLLLSRSSLLFSLHSCGNPARKVDGKESKPLGSSATLLVDDASAGFFFWF